MQAPTRALVVLLLATGALAACRSAEPPIREAEVEEEAPRPAAPAAAPQPEGLDPAELEAERRAEEELETVPLPEPPPETREDGLLEVQFETGTARLTQQARAELDRMYERLLARVQDFFLDIQGHTDPTGNEAANLLLAEQRAEAVRHYLHREKGVPLDRIGVTPFGSAVPVASNHTPSGREQNRRAVVVVLLPP